MTGQKKKSKSQIVNEYLKKVNPYEKPQAINFNLREYAAYIKANGLNGTEITPEMMNKFSKSENSK